MHTLDLLGKVRDHVAELIASLELLVEWYGRRFPHEQTNRPFGELRPIEQQEPEIARAMRILARVKSSEENLHE